MPLLYQAALLEDAVQQWLSFTSSNSELQLQLQYARLHNDDMIEVGRCCCLIGTFSSFVQRKSTAYMVL
jgi:hypothetical protein